MPRWFHRARVAVRSIFRRKRADAELNEEMQCHLEHEIEERMRAGLSRDDARRAAMRAMGAIEKSKEESRDLWRWPGGAALLQDVRFGARLFRKHPGPISVAVAGLAMAIAVVTSVVSIVNATLLRPYAMDDPESVFSVSVPGEHAGVGFPYDQFLRMQESATLATVAAKIDGRGRFSLSRSDEGLANRPISFASGGFLSMLGGRAAMGRSLEPSDDAPGAPPVIVVSYQFWMSTLNADPSMVGKTMWVNETPVTLVGVLQRAFTGPIEIRQPIWATFAAYDDLRMGPPITPAQAPRVDVFGRLRPGVGLRAVDDNLSAIVMRASAPGASAHSGGHGVDVHSASSPADGPAEADVTMVLITVFAVVVLVLALACANTSNLLMAAAVTRMREVGIRLAMGASRARLVAQLLHESVLLGVIAGGLGFVLSFWLAAIFGSLSDLPPDTDVAPDWRVLIFTVGIALVCGLAAGLSPARYGARGNLLVALQSQSGSRGGVGMPSRFRLSFVGFQSAVSILLLVLAALLTRSAIRLTSVDVGFDADRTVGVWFDAPRKKDFDEPAYIRRAFDAVREVPSVQSVSLVQNQPFFFMRDTARVMHEGRSSRLYLTTSDAAFFSTAGLRLQRGRLFTADEAAAEAPVVVVSESLATRFFGEQNPLGRSLVMEMWAGPGVRAQPSARTIIGVVADALVTDPDDVEQGVIYAPIRRTRFNTPNLFVRTSTPGATGRELENLLRGLDARVSPTIVITGEDIDEYLENKRRIALLVSPVALLALFLAAFGVHGVTAFVIGQRTEEMSVRMAIGASARDVLRLLLKDSLRPVAIGIVVGLVLAVITAQLLSTHVSGMSPRDPVSIGGAVATVVLFALVAVLAPARRAAKSDPASLLRQA
jgi:predicted permease